MKIKGYENFRGKIKGYENLGGHLRGAKFSGGKNKGLEIFRCEIKGCENFGQFSKKCSNRVSGVKKDQPLTDLSHRKTIFYHVPTGSLEKQRLTKEIKI